MGEPKLDRFDAMLRDWRAILPKLRDEFARSNCPLTAQAVWNYFETGKVSKPPLLLSGGFVMAECGKSEPIELANIRKRIKQKSHGTHAVVTGAPGKPGEHSVVVANIRGVVYLVDAYNTPGVVSQDIERYLGHLEPFEITFNADIHMVPADKASKFTCRR